MKKSAEEINAKPISHFMSFFNDKENGEEEYEDEKELDYNEQCEHDSGMTDKDFL